MEIEVEGGSVIYTEEALKINHEYVGGPYGGFVLLPLGLRLNREIAEAKVGVALEFLGGERARLLSVKTLKCNDLMTSCLCMVRYGNPIMSQRVAWQRQAVYSGAGVGSVDKDNCLIVFYKKKE
jgi:hypothetical protein